MKKLLGLVLLMLLVCGRLSVGALAAGGTGWVYDEEYDCWYYYKADGTPYNGILVQDGSRFLISDGLMLTGQAWLDTDGDGVDEGYFLDENGVMQTGWVECGQAYDGTPFYGWYGSDGRGYEGWWRQADGWHFYCGGYPSIGVSYLMDDGPYGFDTKGVMVTGWFQQFYDDGSYDWYYFDEDGRGHIGWLWEDGDWYYINNGMMYTGLWEIDGVLYCFRDDGRLVTRDWMLMEPRWAEEDVGARWYFFNADGSARTGWVHGWSYWYYCENGVMVENDFRRVNGYLYYLGEGGVMHTGWQLIGGEWYFFDAEGAGFTGWRKAGGDWYYCSDGWMYCDGVYRIDGVDYVFDSSGAWIG